MTFVFIGSEATIEGISGLSKLVRFGQAFQLTEQQAMETVLHPDCRTPVLPKEEFDTLPSTGTQADRQQAALKLYHAWRANLNQPPATPAKEQ